MPRVEMPELLQARPEYGDACSEVLSVHRAVGAAVISQEVLTVGGPDCISFLHTISSNDIRPLTPGRGCETLLLTPKGKIQFPFSVLSRGDQLELLVDGDPHLAKSLKAVLESAVVMEDLSMTDLPSSYRFVHLAGPKLQELAAAVSLPLPGPDEFSWVEAGGVQVIRRRRSVESGVDIRIPADQAGSRFEKIVAAAGRFGGGPVGSIAQDILRIEAAIPKFGADYTTDHFPQEAALEERAVSFTKGCYTGQEVVARIKTYGNVNRRLVGLILDGPSPAPGDRLFKDGAESGGVTSAARSLKFSRAIAIAMADKSAAVHGGSVQVGSASGPIAKVSDIASPAQFIEMCRISVYDVGQA